MCLAVPMKLESIDGDIGIVNIDGVKRRVGLTLLDTPSIGDYLLVHAGFAIKVIDATQAQKTLQLFKELFEI